MKRYSDYQKDKNSEEITKEELKLVDWTKYKIIVPSKKDKKQLIDAFKHFHDSDIDTEFITVSQLSHEYLNGDNIIVSQKAFDLIDSKK